MDETYGRKMIQIDVFSDVVCPWCFVGKKNLDKAMELSKDRFVFEVRWHPFLLNPIAPDERMTKTDDFKNKFGDQADIILARMKQVFRGLGYEYDLSRLRGSTVNSHRLIVHAGKQGPQKQHDLVEELFLNYFIHRKNIGDRQVLLEAAKRVGLEDAEEILEDPNREFYEVEEELMKNSGHISGVPHYVFNGDLEFGGGQQPEVFLQAFEAAVL